VYAKASLHDIKGAVENLPDLTPREQAPEPLAMTGTDPVLTPISERFAAHLPRAGDVSSRSESDSDVMTQSDEPACFNNKPPGNRGLDASSRLETSSVANAPRRTRTYTPLIESQG